MSCVLEPEHEDKFASEEWVKDERKGGPRLCLSKRDSESFVSPNEPCSAVLTATQKTCSLAAPGCS
jgi:hypothetical protein